MLTQKKLLLIFLVAAALPALGNSANQAALEKCAALANDAEKLTCFEGLTEAGRNAEKMRSTRPSGLLISVPNTATRVDTSPTRTNVTSSTRPVTAPELKAPELKAPESKAPESSAPASDAVLANLGTRNKKKGKTVYPATVSRVEEGGYGHLIFFLDNGQVWRQAEPRHFSVPTTSPFEVEISEAFLGGYRLRIGGDGRFERIKRVK